MGSPSVSVTWPDEVVIDGHHVRGEGIPIEVFNPATEEILGEIPATSLAQCDEAIAGAGRALGLAEWSERDQRSKLLSALADELEARSDVLTSALVQEVGTPVSTAETLQVATPIAILRYFAELARKSYDQDLGVQGPGMGSHSQVEYRPVGVVAAITAYNVPLLLAANKLGAAFAAGCTAVLLPSLRAPLSSVMLAEAAIAAGFPPGVLNVVLGGPEVGQHLSTHRGIGKVSFTGSVGVGRMVMQQAAEHITDIVLELGGKSAAIFLPDAISEESVLGLHQRYTRNAGQGCASPTRLLVPESSVDDFIDLSRQAYAKIQVGDPFDRSTHVGPLIRPEHRDRVESYVAGAVDDGATIVAGGGRPDLGRGWYVNPTLLAGLDNSARICQEEVFGPVAVILTYRDIDEAVEIANDSSLGLHAYVFGDTNEARALAPRLQAGTVTINGGGAYRPDAPLGGFKESGIGRESGEWGLREFFEVQHVVWKVD